MSRKIVWMTTFALSLSLAACSGEEAKDAATSAADSATSAMEQAGDAAGSMAGKAKDVAAGVAGDAVAACRKLAEQGAWDEALEVCKRAHEMMPDDLALEHAYQQAMAASK